MTTHEIGKRLQTVGATAPEAKLLAEIMHLNGWHARGNAGWKQEDLRTWLADFREERALMASNSERTRQARIAAGYMELPVSRGYACGTDDPDR